MLYFSSSCIRTASIENAVNALISADVHNIELSNGNRNVHDIFAWLSDLKRKYKLNILIHNYFPPPADNFVLNLASADEVILKKSVNHCKNAIVMASKLNCPIYSVHAGFRTDPGQKELGKKINSDKIVSYKIAYRIMVRSLKKICDFARQLNIVVAVENHEISRENLVAGENELLLMCEADEFLKLFNDVGRDNLRILLDLGHLNVSAATLKFDKFEFVKKIKNSVALFHLSHNSGLKDEHQIIARESWFWPILQGNPGISCVIESHNLDTNSIKQTTFLFSKMMS